MRFRHVPSLARRAAAVVCALLACAGCAGGGGRPGPVVSAPPPAAADLAAPLEGEWRLTGLQLADGSTRRVAGFVRFDRFSNITLHAEVQPDDPSARPPRLIVADFTGRAAVGDGEFTYAGLAMGVEAERLTVDAVPMDTWRYYEVEGSTLRISARDRTGRTGATLIFERVP